MDLKHRNRQFRVGSKSYEDLLRLQRPGEDETDTSSQSHIPQGTPAVETQPKANEGETQPGFILMTRIVNCLWYSVIPLFSSAVVSSQTKLGRPCRRTHLRPWGHWRSRQRLRPWSPHHLSSNPVPIHATSNHSRARKCFPSRVASGSGGRHEGHGAEEAAGSSRKNAPERRLIGARFGRL